MHVHVCVYLCLISMCLYCVSVCLYCSAPDLTLADVLLLVAALVLEGQSRTGVDPEMFPGRQWLCLPSPDCLTKAFL